MSSLLALYESLEDLQEVETVPLNERIMAAVTGLRSRRKGPYTLLQIAFLADCEPDEVTALAESMGSTWPLDGDGYPRVRQAVFAWDSVGERRRRRRRDAARSVKELRRFRRTFLAAKGGA